MNLASKICTSPMHTVSIEKRESFAYRSLAEKKHRQPVIKIKDAGLMTYI